MSRQTFTSSFAWMDVESRRCVAKSATSYVPAFWYGRLQWLIRMISEFVPSVRIRHMQLNQELLRIARENIPSIVAEYREYERQFNLWEANNCRNGDTTGIIEKEQAAWKRAIELTGELQGKLNEAGWYYRKLALGGDLMRCYEGYLRMDAVYRYWEGLEAFLVSRSS